MTVKLPGEFSYQVTILDADGKLMKTPPGDKISLKSRRGQESKSPPILNFSLLELGDMVICIMVKTALKDDNNQIFDEVSTPHRLPARLYRQKEDMVERPLSK